MSNLKEDIKTGFEDASTRFMRMFDKEEQQVQPVGVKLVLKGQAVPAGLERSAGGFPYPAYPD